MWELERIGSGRQDEQSPDESTGRPGSTAGAAVKVALFGHRNVGKTTLLAMFYRQASSGQVPGLRLAAADARTAEYLAEKIAQIESGQPMAGSLAETELNLRLYHGPARFDLIVKDYQGEHVTLGSEEPIQEFFAGCDAVFLCLDPEGSTEPAERRRRQQEVENLLERYIERSDDACADRPVALLLTKFDRVLAGRGRRGCPKRLRGVARPATGHLGALVERLVDERYGMTRHALAAHAPDGAIFAVSSFGPGAEGNRPPAELHPMGLEGPLGWVAEQLEARDRADMTALWELAPRDLSRLERVVSAYERRYPRSNRSYEFRDRLKTLAQAPAAGPAAASGRRLARWPAAPWPATTPWDSAARRRSSARATRRAGGRAAVVGPAGMAPVAGRVLAVAGAAGPAEKGRVAGQGGRHPGRQRHGGPRPDAPGSDSSRTRRRNWPPPSGRSSRPSEQVRHDRRWKDRPGRGPLAGRHRRPRHPAGADRRASSASSPTPPAAPRRLRWPGRSSRS